MRTKSIAVNMSLLIPALVLAGALSAGPALAQSAPGAPGSSSTIPEKIRPAPHAQQPVEGRSSGTNLSNKLNRTNGVIHPPGNVDPDIKTKVPPHAKGSMPVIKPPTEAQPK